MCTQMFLFVSQIIIGVTESKGNTQVGLLWGKQFKMY